MANSYSQFSELITGITVEEAWIRETLALGGDVPEDHAILVKLFGLEADTDLWSWPDFDQGLGKRGGTAVPPL